VNDSTKWTIGLDIAPLTKINAAELFGASGKDSFQEFILALAVVYNDLKDLIVFQNWLNKKRPANSDPSPFNGEWLGISLHISRLIFGVLHEFLELLKKSTDVLNSPEFRDLLAETRPRTRGRWKTVVAVANGETGSYNSELARSLLIIRNNFSYHYYQPRSILDGFRQRFLSDPKVPKTEFAFCSLGQTVGETRFYFADAAVQGGLEHFTEKFGTPNFSSECLKLIKTVNKTLVEVICSYINSRKAFL